MNRTLLAMAVCLLGAPAALAASPAPAPAAAAKPLAEGWQGDFLSAPVILAPPAAAVRSETVLISGADGWSAEDDALAERLKAAGSLVIGLDYPTIVRSVNASTDDCAYLVSDIESLSHYVQRNLGNPDYRLPVVAGLAEGGTLALGIVAQTPGATIERTVAVDPGDRLPLDKPLCTPAARELTPSGTIYALTAGALPDPVEIVFSQEASDAGRAHAERLDDVWEAIDVHNADASRADAAFAALKPEAPGAAGGALAGLPLAILDAVPTRDAMAVVYSGDGGWRDLDKVVAEHLQAAGVPVVGVDSLRYFWSEKTPESTAADLQAIVDTYAKRWNVSKVYLVGYSFGADILPSTYLALGEDYRKRVERLSLMAMAENADYQVSVGGWLGLGSNGRSTIADLARIPSALVQCFYGADETDSGCPALRGKGPEVIETEGGHHFDGNYEALAEKILG